MRDVDQIIRRIQEAFPGVQVRQLKVRFPGRDDDGIWFFTHPETDFEVQIESGYGTCPFLIETTETNDRFNANSIEETVQTVIKLLHLAE